MPSAVTLTFNDNSSLVGEPITWTADASAVGPAPVHQFSAAPHGGTFHVLRDLNPANSLT